MSKAKAKSERGQFIPAYTDILDSPAFLACSTTAQALWLHLRRFKGSTNNGIIGASLGTLKHRGFKSSATVFRALRELETVGLIAKTRQGGIAHNSKVPSLWRFTDEGVYPHPKHNIGETKATNEWREIKSLRVAQAMIKDAHKQAIRPNLKGTGRGAQKKPYIQKMNLKDLDSESNPLKTDSESEQEQPLQIQNLNAQNEDETYSTRH